MDGLCPGCISAQTQREAVMINGWYISGQFAARSVWKDGTRGFTGYSEGLEVTKGTASKDKSCRASKTVRQLCHCSHGQSRQTVTVVSMCAKSLNDYYMHVQSIYK